MAGAVMLIFGRTERSAAHSSEGNWELVRLKALRASSNTRLPTEKQP
jgi:hypothetical protein